jgi:hypothetical protein
LHQYGFFAVIQREHENKTIKKRFNESGAKGKLLSPDFYPAVT